MTVRTIASANMLAYFERLEKELTHCYEIAEMARKQGKDPELHSEIPAAEDLAARVEKLVGPEGIAERIRELSKDYSREEVAIRIGSDIVERQAGTAADTSVMEKAIDQGIRTALAVLTEGVLVAPLEGIADIKVKKNDDGSSYLSIYYAGPIRASGGTAQALSVLIGDVLRRTAGLGTYKPTDSEVERYKEEIPLYKQAQHLQYSPSTSEVELIARNCPVCVDGEGTEDVEVSGNRNLPRVETNRVRGGACLVIAEGMCLKAPKIQKHVKKLKIDGWEFIDTFVNKGKDEKKDDAAPGAIPEVPPNWKYMKELIAGRPVFSHPSRKGGFRLRYGRCRCTGLAAMSINPATMFLLDEFLAIGTQVKIERPGKAGAITPCSTIEGPIVLLNNGDLRQINDMDEALAIRSDVHKIIDLGEALIPYGEFSENNHVLMQGTYAPEWWEQEFEEALKKHGAEEQPDGAMTAERAFALSERYDVPLHPDFNLFWHDLTTAQIVHLAQHIKASATYADGVLTIPRTAEIKDILIDLGALHAAREGTLITTRYAYPIIRCCGLDVTDGAITETPRFTACEKAEEMTPMQLTMALVGIRIMERSATRIGGRMGRPEKAEERRMSPPPNVLFPLGEAGGKQRLVRDAADDRWIKAENATNIYGRSTRRYGNGNGSASLAREPGCIIVEVGTRTCPACGKETISYRCECGEHTVPQRHCPRCGRAVDDTCPACEISGTGSKEQTVNLKQMLAKAQEALGEPRIADGMKGVVGIISRNKSPEPLEKGILRVKHGIYVFKDGTVRFDMGDVPLTHFRPREVGTTVEKLRSIGYTVDYLGRPLENEEQVLELRVQDVVLPTTCGDFLVKTATYLDDLLVRFYGLEPYYNVTRREDLVGHLLIGLAPHTSAGLLSRVVGYTKAKAQYAHPFFHAGKRRNCDGDEDAFMLALDGLINFSRSYLPSSRGGLMDAPLVLGTRIDPSEIDKEAQNVDVMHRYPLEFYYAGMRHAHPNEVKDIIDQVATRIGTEAQYEGFGFTHDTADISAGPAASAYKTLGAMLEKMDAELTLATKLRPVDKADVARRVIESHFLPDLLGNLKAFSTQSFRCPKCNTKYRRVPLKGVCLNCGGNLTMTVHHGSIIKYLEVSKKISEQYNVANYTRQRIDLVEQSVSSIFQSDKVKKCTIDDFF